MDSQINLTELRHDIATAYGFHPWTDKLLALIDIAEAARDLHDLVEGNESVGICLTDRVPSLRLGDALARIAP